MRWRGMEEHGQSESGVPLSTRLRERRVLIEQYVPAEIQAVTRQTVETLRTSGIEQRVLQPGTPSPGFALPDHNGKPVSSTDLLSRGRLVLLFLRGRWCPFCVAQVEAMNEVLVAIRQAQAELIAICPQTVHQCSLMRDQHHLSFSLLSDSGNRVASQFGLVYRV